MRQVGTMYHITRLCPRTDIDMGRCGFSINLYPAWRQAVEDSKLTQHHIDTAIKNYHRAWLDGCGYDAIFDPDKDPLAEWEERNLGKKSKPGPNARPLYDIHSIRVAWGEWGPEHITVPGNACGLDIDRSSLTGCSLVPHNIDNFGQVILLLTVFTTFAEHVIDKGEVKDP